MDSKLSEYERKRLENIRHNQQVLESLKVPILPLKVSPARNAKVAPPSRDKRKKIERVIIAKEPPSPPTLRRTSTRLLEKAMGKASSMSVADELALYRTNLLVKELKPRPKRTLGSIPFEPENGEATKDFLKIIESAILNDDFSKVCRSSGKRRYRVENEFCIAKVSQERIYSMAIHPHCSKIIVSAGGKDGSLGIWDATTAWQGQAESRQTFYFKPHSAAITNQRYNPTNPKQLWMTSYDGMVRCMDIPKGQFSEVYHSENEQFISGFDVSSDGSLLFFTDLDGVLTQLDVRTKMKVTYQLHEKKAGGLSLSPVNNNYLATSSLDDTICVWDMRMLKKDDLSMISRFEYKRAVTSVFFHPQVTDLMVSTSYDDTIRIHQGFLNNGGSHHSPTELRITHNNQTGRWITPFRAIWDPKSTTERYSHVIAGNMNRGLDVIEMATGICTNSISEIVTSQPAVNAAHPVLDIIVSGNASGKCVLWKPY